MDRELSNSSLKFADFFLLSGYISRKAFIYVLKLWIGTQQNCGIFSQLDYFASPPGKIQIHSSVLFKVFQIQYICYRPQRSCEGYVFTGVCLSTGGWYPSMPCRWYPSMPCSRSLGEGGRGGGVGGVGAIPACIAGGIPACLATGLQGVCLVLGGVSTLGEGGLLQGVVCSRGLVSQHELRQTSQEETATAVDGTHPTGMHSCFNFVFNGL